MHNNIPLVVSKMSKNIEQIESYFDSSSKLILDSKTLSPQIQKAIELIQKAIRKGNKVVIFGNGGSAADAQHIAAELIGRFKIERKSIPAIALNTDSSILTSLSNDYSFDVVFQRQCEGLIGLGDVVIGISTSGKSKNVEKGLKIANKKGAFTVGLLGNDGGIINEVANSSIIVKSNSTARIQEAHRVIYHIICQIAEEKLSNMEKINE